MSTGIEDKFDTHLLISLHSTARNIRKWTSSDEVRLELLLRADRAHVLANGANPKATLAANSNVDG